jgi:hypothetical protein
VNWLAVIGPLIASLPQLNLRFTTMVRYLTALLLIFNGLLSPATGECDTVTLEGLAPSYGYSGLMGAYRRSADGASFSGPTTTGICFVQSTTGECPITWKLYYIAAQKLWVVGPDDAEAGANILLYSPLVNLRFNSTLSTNIRLITVRVVVAIAVKLLHSLLQHAFLSYPLLCVHVSHPLLCMIVE